MALYELIDRILWGRNEKEHTKYNRLGDVYIFRFCTVQIIRTIFVVINFICLFLSLYINTRTFLFQLHNWAIFYNFFSLFLVWIISGHQRTEILLNTNAYAKLKSKKSTISVAEDNEDYVVEMIKTHLWKASIINYEIAQELSLFSIIMFWVFWRQKILDFQKYDHHSTGKIEMALYWKQIIRYIIIYWANTVAPVYMIIDFLVTKIVFKFRHLVFCILIAGGYLALFAIGYQIINDSDPFPLNKDNIYTVYTPVAFVGILLNHFVFTLISKAKWMYTKDPSEYGGEDSEVEKIIEKYKHFVKKRAIAYNSSIRSSIIDEIRATDLIKAKDIEFKFMREVVYNYLDMDVKRKRVNWSKVGKIKDIIEESKENMEESHIE